MARSVWPFASVVGHLPAGPKKKERLSLPGTSCLKAGLVWSFSTHRGHCHHASFPARSAEAISADALSPSALLHLCPAGGRPHRAKTSGSPHLSLVHLVCSTKPGDVLGAAPNLCCDGTSGMARRKTRKFLGRSL